MALRLVRGIRRESEPVKRRKSREEYLIACLGEEAHDPKFTDWERKFIASLARQVGQGRTVTAKQKEILQRIWEK